MREMNSNPVSELGEERPIAATMDDETLEELGYRQEFKRTFSRWSIFSLSFSTMGLLPSMAATLDYSLG
jgi:hypothetical protein